MRTLILSIAACIFFQSFAIGQISKTSRDSTSLADRWLINRKPSNPSADRVQPYKPVYFLGGNYTSDINNKPSSLNPLNTVTTATSFSKWELKFQLSFKARLLDFKGVDIWVGYTQSSRWQLYSGDLSRPFRETNYEPEFLFVFPTSYQLFGIQGVYFNVGFNHQSNGKSNPYSRSWNRIIFETGMEYNNWTILLKPWFRIQETFVDDNNPNIEDYVGRMEVISAYSNGRHDFSAQLRHSLKSGVKSRGSVQLDYAYAISEVLQIHTQFFHGYGESLIDYNHKQTTFGLGFSLIQWK